MRQVVPGVFQMEGLAVGNVYLVVSVEGLVLVDSGAAGNAERILTQIQRQGFSLSDLHTILLTHAHFDHQGSAAEIVRRCGVRVLAHRDEIPYIEKLEQFPFQSVWQRGMDRIETIFLSNPMCKVNMELNDGDLIERSGSLQAIHTPGHTPGSLSLYRPEGNIVFCGDALFNQNPFTFKPGLRLPLDIVTVDMHLARQSVEKLIDLDIEVLCCGHGEPIVGRVREQLKRLLV
jgi:glyoxylase-like metal-dependent hydrolase (beta-lactamase superfamily II)